MGLQIERIYDDIRSLERANLTKRTDEVYAAVPELARIPEERRDTIRKLAKREITSEQASEIIKKLKKTEDDLLKKNGYSSDMLELHYHCDKCQDTGWIDKSKRHACSCRLLLSARMNPQIGVNEKETFEKYSESIFTNDEQKKKTINAKKWCEKYADSLPTPEKQNVLLMGMTGLGKSYLSNAIAYRALEHGIEARKTTAYTFVQDALRTIQEHKNGLDSYYMNVPLLILDDLGSEATIPNVTEEALFSVLNERINKKLCTVIATNLSVVALQDKYGERVTSRLMDTAISQAILLKGDNLRWGEGSC